FDGPPEDSSSRLIPYVERLDESIWRLVKDQTSDLSKGGMASKLAAAQMVTRAGESVVIAGGREPDVLTRILEGEEVGTFLAGQGTSIPSRKRWIGFSAPPAGHLVVDPGAARALIQEGRSLLAIGVTAVEGDFQKGDVVAVVGPDGNEVARGLTNYGSADLQRIRGLHSERIAQVLGHRPYEEVIHRDNLTVLA
ncbi:MAG TPA: glutamate 5-kinase, partial [Planctomycetaceae bacterium]|nr:glutamate 5-kinase [Planctomycetaceae bacterium]